MTNALQPLTVQPIPRLALRRPEAAEALGSSERTPVTEPTKLLDVRAVAELLSCSSRHVYRLSDAGLMPRPLRLGSLVRWRRELLDEWIIDGCPALRRASR